MEKSFKGWSFASEETIMKRVEFPIGKIEDVLCSRKQRKYCEGNLGKNAPCGSGNDCKEMVIDVEVQSVIEKDCNELDVQMGEDN